MTDRTARFAFVAACTVAPLAVVGSAFSLYRIAEGAGLALPLALPVALDFTALAAAAQIRARRHLTLAWVTLVAGVLGSAALQVADAWALGPIAWGVHGALPLAALVCFEFTVPDKASTPEPAAAKPKPRPAPKPAVSPETPPAPEVKPTPIRPPRPNTQPLRPAADVDLVAMAVETATAMGKEPGELTRAELQAAVKTHPSRGGRGIGTARAGEILEQLRTRPALELVEADR
jgi:hypothetical protein